MSYQKIILIGNLGGDPETKRFDGGNSVTSFSLATSETYKNKLGEKVTETEWHAVKCWGKLSEIAEKYLNKGDKVVIEGKLKTRSWENESGEKKYAIDVVAQSLVMLGRKKEGSDNQQPANEEDDLPF